MNIASPVFYLFYVPLGTPNNVSTHVTHKPKKDKKKSSKKRRLEEEMHKCEH